MTYGDPRGPNIIPFGRRTLDKLRAITRDRPSPPERPWPFNALGPSPYHRSTLPPVPAKRFGRAVLTDEEIFSFREQSELNDIFDVPRAPMAQPATLEDEIELAIDRYSRTHRDLTIGTILLALLAICKDLAKALKLPSR